MLDAFQGINQFDMRDDAIKRKLNINIYDCNEAFNRYYVIDTWVGDESKPEYHNALLYSDMHHGNLLSYEKYNQYVVDSKRYENRWDYLLHYNDTDV